MPVVQDVNWITSRQPSDIPQFNQAMINLIEEICVQKTTSEQPQTRSQYAFGEHLPKQQEK